MASLQNYFERFVLVALEKQERLNHVLRNHNMNLDLETGMASFSGGLTCSCQILGTESENTLTWLWGWAEEQTEIPETMLTKSRELKLKGANEQIPELLSPSLDLSRTDGNMLASVASMLCDATAFYRDHYEGGALFMLLYCERSLLQKYSFDRAGILSRLHDLAQIYHADFPNILLSYFQERRLPVEKSGDQISGELMTGERIIADLDQQGRILLLNGEPFAEERRQ